MRYALFSDIHANLEAFEAVLADIQTIGADQHVFLGDIVGYGPNPNECMDLLLKTADVTLGGNHDWAVAGTTADDYFNPFAKAALDWTIQELKDEHIDFLKRTKATDMLDGFQLAHSSPLTPEGWRYILSQEEALENYPHIENGLCFIGHSHQPLVIEYPVPGKVQARREPKASLNPDMKYIVNIGSVGQPRDGNPKSCWVLYDSDMGTVEFRRVEYDIEVVQKKMLEKGLPKYLIDRLSEGR